MDKIKSWWSKDDAELAEEETRMTPTDRDLEKGNVEAEREDLAPEAGGEFGTMPPGHADFESDSERPR